MTAPSGSATTFPSLVFRAESGSQSSGLRSTGGNGCPRGQRKLALSLMAEVILLRKRSSFNVKLNLSGQQVRKYPEMPKSTAHLNLSIIYLLPQAAKRLPSVKSCMDVSGGIRLGSFQLPCQPSPGRYFPPEPFSRCYWQPSAERDQPGIAAHASCQHASSQGGVWLPSMEVVFLCGVLVTPHPLCICCFAKFLHVSTGDVWITRAV